MDVGSLRACVWGGGEAGVRDAGWRRGGEAGVVAERGSTGSGVWRGAKRRVCAESHVGKRP